MAAMASPAEMVRSICWASWRVSNWTRKGLYMVVVVDDSPVVLLSVVLDAVLVVVVAAAAATFNVVEVSTGSKMRGEDSAASNISTSSFPWFEEPLV